MSSQRPPTSNSNLDVLMTNTVGSMKKRLSMLRMGRKNSKASVQQVEILQEE